MTGCQSSGTGAMDEESLTSFRCWHFRDQDPITREQVAYILKQSQRGNLACKTILGHMHERGQGVPKNIAKAKAIYKALADVDESAYLELGRLAEEGAGEPVNYFKARQLYERAAQKGSTAATTKLAALMEQGKGGPQDLEGALILYTDSLRRYRDDSWKGIKRLRSQGLTLSIEQQKKCIEIWNLAHSRLFNRAIFYVQEQVRKEANANHPLGPATISLIFSAESETPKISITESSGDPTTDQKILTLISHYNFHGGPILPNGQKSWTVSLIIPL